MSGLFSCCLCVFVFFFVLICLWPPHAAEAGAALAMTITATLFLPRYMALGLTTTSGFLGALVGGTGVQGRMWMRGMCIFNRETPNRYMRC